MALRTLVALLLLVGCGPGSAPAVAPSAPAGASPAERPAASLALDADGLRAVSASGSTTPLAFGLPFDAAVGAVSRLRGAPAERGDPSECDGGPLGIASWADGLTLYATDDQFAGWSLGGRSADGTLTTMTGLGVGAARAALDGPYAVEIRETSLGTEFGAGGLRGLLSGPGDDATVVALWAGVSCTVR